MRRSAPDQIAMVAGTPFDRLRNRVEDAYSAMSGTRKTWRELWSWYDGSGQLSWKSKIKPESLQIEASATNFIFAAIETYVSNLMQDDASWFVVSEEGEQDTQAQSATSWMQGFYDAHHLAAERSLAYRYGLIMGTGVIYPYYDPNRREAAVRAVDPCDVVVDPSATHVEDAEWVALRNIYSLALARRMFKKIPEDIFGSVEMQGLELASLSDEDGEINTEDIDAASVADPQLVVWEVYHEFGAKRTVYCGSVKLFDGPNPYPDKRIPFVFFRLQPRRKHFWGAGIVEQIKDLQDAFNKLRTRVAIWCRYVAAPVMVVQGHVEDLNVDPGGVIKLPINGNAAYLRPPDMPADVWRMLEEIPSDMDVITGVHDITRGIRPKGTTSGISLEVLQQAAQVRLTGPGGDWSVGWAEVGQRLLEIMQRHYGAKRTMALMRGAAPERISIAPEDLSGVEVDEAGEGRAAPYSYRVVCQPKGELPLSPATIAELMIQLSAMPAEDGKPMVDRIAVLQAIKPPGWHDILERMMKTGNAEMQGQMEAMGAMEGQQGADQQAMMQQQAQQEQAMSAGTLAQAGIEQVTAMLQESLSPEQMAMLMALSEGQAGEDVLTALLAQLPPDIDDLVLTYLQAAAQTQAQPQEAPTGLAR